MALLQSRDHNMQLPHDPISSHIRISRPYVFQQTIQQCIRNIETKDDLVRLQAVAYIDGIRKELQMPVRTFNTAVIYYLKYHLIYPNDNRFIDIVATAVFVAGKIEDTLKQSTDVLAAAHGLRLPLIEQVLPYETRFETHPKIIVSFERLMLEASRFDFRDRHPQMLLLKVAKRHRVQKDTVGKTAFNMSLDAYRTFAPLKQTRATLAVACVELSARIFRQNVTELEAGKGYIEFRITRAEVMETLLDLLDLYTQHQSATIVGRDHNLNTFLSIRIALNLEASANHYPRYAQSIMEKASGNNNKHLATYGTRDHCEPGQKPVVNARENASDRLQYQQSATPSKNSTRFPKETVRYVLDPERAKNEKRATANFFGFFEVDEAEDEVKRPVKRGGERGGERSFERDGEQREGRAGERESYRRRGFAKNSSPYFCPRNNPNQKMGSKVDFEHKMAEGLAGRQVSDARRGQGQYGRWENRTE